VLLPYARMTRSGGQAARAFIAARTAAPFSNSFMTVSIVPVCTVLSTSVSAESIALACVKLGAHSCAHEGV
jgi:hypothetical protein